MCVKFKQSTNKLMQDRITL